MNHGNRSQFPKVEYWKTLHEGQCALIREGFTDGNRSICIRIVSGDGSSWVERKSFNDQVLQQLYVNAKGWVEQLDKGEMTWNTMVQYFRGK